MSKYGSSSVIAVLDGTNILGAKLRGLNLKIESIFEECSGLGDAHETNGPVGKQRATLTQTGGYFDTQTGGLHQAMTSGGPLTPQSTPRTFVVGCQGQTVGAIVYGVQGEHTNAYEVVLEDSKLSKANVMHALAGLVEQGVLVQPLATFAADWNTKTLGTVVDFTTNPANHAIPITSNSQAVLSVVTTAAPHGLTTGDLVLIAGVTGSSPTINGERTVTVLTTTTFSVPVNTSAGTGGTGGTLVRANSATGAAGYLHVTALTGFTGFVGKLRDSPDDVTYADLITFANVTTAPASERATVSGTVDRYLSFDGNVTGAGSITVLVMLARL